MGEPRKILQCGGVIVDGETRTVWVNGRMVPVTGVAYSAAAEDRPGTDRVKTPELEAIALLIYGSPEAVVEACEREIPGRSEACHFNIVCENGWWVDVSLWPEDDKITFAPKCQAYDDIFDHRTAADLLLCLDEVAARPQFVPSAEDIEAYNDNPWCGLAPGTWIDTDFGEMPDA